MRFFNVIALLGLAAAVDLAKKKGGDGGVTTTDLTGGKGPTGGDGKGGMGEKPERGPLTPEKAFGALFRTLDTDGDKEVS